MNKKISLGAAIALMAIVAAAMFSITMVYSRRTFNETVLNIKDRESQYSKLSEIDKWVGQNFFGSIDRTRLMDSIAKGYVVGTGDPYAKYYTVEEYTKMNQEGASKDVGVGIETRVDESGYVLVTAVYPESPALAAGMEAGDLIVKVDETDITEDNVQDAQKAILGEPGSSVELTVRRNNVDTAQTLVRRDVEKPSVYTTLTEDRIGYVQIQEFNANTADQFNRGVDKLVSDGATALVFDVRNNSGTILEPVTRILDKLLPQGDIVSASYNDGTVEVLATSDPASINLPMVVLQNEKTASSAEIFAQALTLADDKRARSVGTLTMGKGSMQQTHQLSDGSAIEITVAKYVLADGTSFDGVGVRPDYEVKISPDQAEAIVNLEKIDSTTFERALLIDSQLKKAMELASTGANSSADTASSPSSSSEDAEEVIGTLTGDDEDSGSSSSRRSSRDDEDSSTDEEDEDSSSEEDSSSGEEDEDSSSEKDGSSSDDEDESGE